MTSLYDFRCNVYDAPMRKELLLEKCSRHFEFLVSDYGFKAPKVQSDETEIQMIWLSPKTGLELMFDRMENTAYVFLHQLQNGRLIQDDPEDDESPLTYFSIEDIVELRAPEMDLSELGPVAELSGPQLDKNLELLTGILKSHCKDILQGNFHFFSTLEAVERMRRQPDGSN